MKKMFDDVSFDCSKLVTKRYSTSFSWAVKMLSPSIRNAIYSIYGFVRFADEIVDSFHDYDKRKLIDEFEKSYYDSYDSGISLNPILNSFHQTVKKYNITDDLVKAFLRSMKLDLDKKVYTSTEEYKEYIYGSADVVGLMCLKVFVQGDEEKYQVLKEEAMRLGSAFQKVNFLRDYKDDNTILCRNYFPSLTCTEINDKDKQAIIQDIEGDFKIALNGIKKLPIEAKFGVYIAYVYYKKLLYKLKNTSSETIKTNRVRISNFSKFCLILKSFLFYKLRFNKI